MKRVKRISAIVMVFAFAGIVYWVYWQIYGPFYDGKSLESWFRDIRTFEGDEQDQRRGFDAFIVAGPDGLAFLEAKFHSQNVEERRKAVWLLWTLHPHIKPRLSAVTPLFNDQDNEVRWRATDLLYAVEPVGPEIRLKMAALLRDADVMIRRKAAFYLGRMHDPTGSDWLVDELVRANKDPDAFVRSKAMDSLYCLNPQLALPILINAMTNEDLPIRYQAFETLENMGSAADTSAIPALTIALDDPNPLIRSSASNSIARINRNALPKAGNK